MFYSSGAFGQFGNRKILMYIRAFTYILTAKIFNTSREDLNKKSMIEFLEELEELCENDFLTEEFKSSNTKDYSTTFFKNVKLYDTIREMTKMKSVIKYNNGGRRPRHYYVKVTHESEYGSGKISPRKLFLKFWLGAYLDNDESMLLREYCKRLKWIRADPYISLHYSPFDNMRSMMKYISNLSNKSFTIVCRAPVNTMLNESETIMSLIKKTYIPTGDLLFITGEKIEFSERETNSQFVEIVNGIYTRVQRICSLEVEKTRSEDLIEAEIKNLPEVRYSNYQLSYLLSYEEMKFFICAKLHENKDIESFNFYKNSLDSMKGNNYIIYTMDQKRSRGRYIEEGSAFMRFNSNNYILSIFNQEIDVIYTERELYKVNNEEIVEMYKFLVGKGFSGSGDINYKDNCRYFDKKGIVNKKRALGLMKSGFNVFKIESVIEVKLDEELTFSLRKNKKTNRASLYASIKGVRISSKIINIRENRSFGKYDISSLKNDSKNVNFSIEEICKDWVDNSSYSTRRVLSIIASCIKKKESVNHMERNSLFKKLVARVVSESSVSSKVGFSSEFDENVTYFYKETASSLISKESDSLDAGSFILEINNNYMENMLKDLQNEILTEKDNETLEYSEILDKYMDSTKNHPMFESYIKDLSREMGRNKLKFYYSERNRLYRVSIRGEKNKGDNLLIELLIKFFEIEDERIEVGSKYSIMVEEEDEEEEEKEIKINPKKEILDKMRKEIDDFAPIKLNWGEEVEERGMKENEDINSGGTKDKVEEDKKYEIDKKDKDEDLEDSSSNPFDDSEETEEENLSKNKSENDEKEEEPLLNIGRLKDEMDKYIGSVKDEKDPRLEDK
jgi:hypothetical protein